MFPFRFIMVCGMLLRILRNIEPTKSNISYSLKLDLIVHAVVQRAMHLSIKKS